MDIEQVVEQFESSELVQVAEFIGLSPTSRWPKRKLIDVINYQLKLNGLPESAPESRDMTPVEELVEDYLFVAGYVTEDGDVIEEATNELTLEQFMTAHNIKAKPPCYGRADDDEPDCKRCAVYKYCAVERIIQLPPCFGVLHDTNHLECKGCLEYYFCKMAMPT